MRTCRWCHEQVAPDPVSRWRCVETGRPGGGYTCTGRPGTPRQDPGERPHEPEVELQSGHHRIAGRLAPIAAPAMVTFCDCGLGFYGVTVREADARWQAHAETAS